MSSDWRNKLYFGDNLALLRQFVASKSIDLIYLDPRFNSKVDDNLLFKTTAGESSAAQATAFKDTWDWDEAAAAAFHDLRVDARIPSNSSFGKITLN